MLKMIIMVPVTMGCALVGTVGLIKLIKKICPGPFDQSGSTNKEEKEEQ